MPNDAILIVLIFALIFIISKLLSGKLRSGPVTMDRCAPYYIGHTYLNSQDTRNQLMQFIVHHRSQIYREEDQTIVLVQPGNILHPKRYIVIEWTNDGQDETDMKVGIFSTRRERFVDRRLGLSCFCKKLMSEIADLDLVESLMQSWADRNR
jgi:hypothetical protein